MSFLYLLPLEYLCQCQWHPRDDFQLCVIFWAWFKMFFLLVTKIGEGSLHLPKAPVDLLLIFCMKSSHVARPFISPCSDMQILRIVILAGSFLAFSFASSVTPTSYREWECIRPAIIFVWEGLCVPLEEWHFFSFHVISAICSNLWMEVHATQFERSD